MLTEITKSELFEIFSKIEPTVWTREGVAALYDYLEELNGEDGVIHPNDEEIGHYEYHTLDEFNSDMMTDFATVSDVVFHDSVVAVASNGHIITRQ